MAYDNITDRSNTSALVPEQVARDMLGRVEQEDSAALRMMRRIPVSSTQTRFPILSALPIAYWVTGDTGLKQTSEMAWDNKYMNIEELAVIVPLPENVVDDLLSQGVDIWGEIEPEIRVHDEIARQLDSTVFFGINAPASFPTNVSAAAAAAGNTTAEDATQAQGGIQDDLDEAIGLVESDGFDPNGIVASRNLRGKLRRARSTTGEKLEGVGADLNSYDGMPIAYPMRGLWPTTVRALVGDWTEFVIGVRKDITMKLLDQAVIQDNTGAIVYNLAQQDMVAMRFTFRAGWQVSNRINRDQPTEANRYPVARLTYTP